ncbi:U3 small nucleolar RNA-associated protein 14 homolog A-like [Actinia tenebrosa]|uniref:U3 small nucleolar RNA-associated protein 14 homolog A-like n=1 Tax=Actinia tenebrosa TaxID=6105 RepID=A0A6P8HP06_ACTTE|nr:U3 small nucleolar RNA-associated protein 14 homolog A-like [Actinia tenebrosa]
MAAKEALKLVATVNEDSDVEVDDQLLSSSDNESDGQEESRHSNVIKIIKNLDKKSSKRKRNQRSEPNLKVSEFHLSSGGDNEKIDIKDLIGSLQKEGQYGKLKKKLESMEKNAATLDVPLPQLETNKIQRTIAFEETSKEVGKWQPIVKKNREAEHLSFPLNPYKPPEITTKSLSVTFKPRTPLEQEIAAVLNGSSHLMERKNNELTEEEEQALLAMDLEEAKERRSELQRLRALQSYYEEKCRRAKKIKSKKYHRIKKKSEQRAASKLSIEELQLKDPQKAAEELEKMDRIRAEERLSLKHRSTSKWAKNLLIRGHKNPEAKKAIQEQLELSRKLTEKQQVHTESDDDDDDDTNAIDPSSMFGNLKADSNNPWSLDTNTRHEKTTGSVQDNETTAGFKRIPAINVQETTEKANNESEDDSESAEDNTEDDFEIKVSNKPKKGKKKSKKRKTKDQDWIEKETPKKKESYKSKVNKVKTKVKGKSKDEEEDDLLEILMPSDEESNNDNEKPPTSVETFNTSHAKGKSVIVDPNKIFQMEEYNSNKVLTDNTDNSDHILNIQQAFANDDVIEEFVREKEEAMESSKGKDLDLTLPGWGDWGGPGAKVTSKKKKFVKKAEDPPPRKDRNLAHVIINEEDDKRLAKLQVKNIPHLYMSSEQFEKSIRNPVGKDWNTGSTVKQLIKPRVQTLMGSIIEPIKPTKNLKRSNAHSSVDKKRLKKKDEGLTIYN